MYVDKGHRHTISLNHVEKEHYAMADLKLSDLVIFEHILQLVGAQTPYSIGIFQ